MPTKTAARRRLFVHYAGRSVVVSVADVSRPPHVFVPLMGVSVLADDRYVVEWFRARADGDIVPAPAEALAAKGARKTKHKVVSRKEVEAMRPDRTEIIICTGLTTRGGRQACGSIAAGLLCDRKQKG